MFLFNITIIINYRDNGFTTFTTKHTKITKTPKKFVNIY